MYILFVFFFNDTATTEIYTLSLHDALPISLRQALQRAGPAGRRHRRAHPIAGWREHRHGPRRGRDDADPAPATRTRGSPSAALEAASRARDQIGRASCRERV